MNILESINEAPNDWMVDLRSKDSTKVKSFPVGDLKKVMLADPTKAADVKHFYPGGEQHVLHATCPCKPTVNDIGIVHRSWTGNTIHH